MSNVKALRCEATSIAAEETMGSPASGLSTQEASKSIVQIQMTKQEVNALMETDFSSAGGRRFRQLCLSTKERWWWEGGGVLSREGGI